MVGHVSIHGFPCQLRGRDRGPPRAHNAVAAVAVIVHNLGTLKEKKRKNKVVRKVVD